MHKFSIKKATIEYISYMTLVFALLFIISQFFFNEIKEKDESETITSTIKFEDDNTKVHVEYPRFKDKNINKIITDILYTYVKDFKSNDKNKSLDITYDLYYFDNYVNVFFDIADTLNNVSNKNILINLDTKNIDYISSIYDRDYLDNEIKEQVFYKYSNSIYEKIKDENINNFTYYINENELDVYINNIEFEEIDYIPNIQIVFKTNTEINDNDYEGKKYIAFTYDDGPSEYTSDLLKTLEANKSSATFFMIGNRINNFEETVKEIYKSNSEMGTHTYSHKDLSAITEKDIKEEINTSNVIYYNITGENYKYIRPPYGKYNKAINDYNMKVILWNIDPKDWLVKDSNIIYNNVIKNACDGCIVLMHDIYPETIEATKKLIPELNEKGYEVVSISKLLELKQYNNENNIISYIK